MADLIANNDEASTWSGVNVVVDVLANDTLNGAPVKLLEITGPPVITTPPAFGSASVDPSGAIVYSPTKDFVGVVEIEYEIAVADAPSACATGSDVSEDAGLVFSEEPAWWSEVVAQNQASPGSVQVIVADHLGRLPGDEPMGWGVLYLVNPDMRVISAASQGDVPFNVQVDAQLHAAWRHEDGEQFVERLSCIHYLYARS